MQVLTDEEICKIRDDQKYFDPCEFARAIEAAVLERFEVDGYFYASNTGSLPLPEAYAGEPDVYPLYRLRETE